MKLGFNEATALECKGQSLMADLEMCEKYGFDPDSKRLVINAGGTKSVRLKNGQYRVAASVSAANVSNYAGSENLNGGSYNVDYYISTYRY